MNYKAKLIDNVFFVHWLAPPQPSEIRELLPQIAEIGKQVGGKFAYVSAVAPSAKVPNAEQRKSILGLIDECKKHCSVVHMIMKGNDLQHNLQRVIVQSLLIVTRIYDNFLVIHKGTESVTADLTQRLGRDASETMRKAVEAGVL